jgi:hypothetical protein
MDFRSGSTIPDFRRHANVFSKRLCGFACFIVITVQKLQIQIRKLKNGTDLNDVSLNIIKFLFQNIVNSYLSLM